MDTFKIGMNFDDEFDFTTKSMKLQDEHIEAIVQKSEKELLINFLKIKLHYVEK